MRKISTLLAFLFFTCLFAQTNQVMTPEKLWELGRVGLEDIHPSGKKSIYGVSRYNLNENSSMRELFEVDIATGESKALTQLNGKVYSATYLVGGEKIGFVYKGQYHIMDANGQNIKQLTEIPDGIQNVKVYERSGEIFLLFSKEFKTQKSTADLYPNLPKAEAMVTDDLMYRHWDSWSDDKNQHVCFTRLRLEGGKSLVFDYTDIMKDETFDSPMLPFGGAEDFELSPDAKNIAYVSKKKMGKDYAVSTNSDIYLYNIENKTTSNLTKGMMGYDKNPSWSPEGSFFSWTSMPKDGYESDVNELWLMDVKTGQKFKLVEKDYISSYVWAEEDRILYNHPKDGTEQLNEVEFTFKKNGIKRISQGELLTDQHNYNHFLYANGTIVIERQDMNQATELFALNKKNKLSQITKVNDNIYSSLLKSKVEKRMVTTTDGKQMLTWVIYPPDFDPSKKYPTLLYCQGGPQSQVSQFYSFRWNFQLMAANGYIVVAPNRRGLPGFGVDWNEDISQDWGGQAMKDYLSAIDDISKESYVDTENLGAVGASYGGYSVYMLAGIHEKRFKALISHCGLFNLESWYGSTEEMFFANWDIGGPYWDPAFKTSYTQFNPKNFVQNWDAPILVIHGGLDFRVPINQGMEAFQAAQLRNVPSRFLYFPNEGHWVLSPQNGLLWHSEFFGWLDKWLK
jgi:dipeptidyl aminopeptidase/acylaminoacyl peptidase